MAFHNSFGKFLRNRRLLRRALHNVFYLIVANKISLIIGSIIIEEKTNKCKNLAELVNVNFNTFSSFPFRYFKWTIRATQIREEIRKLLKILAVRNPKLVLEIGTANGGTLFLFSRVSRFDAIIISVDLPGGQFGGGYPEWRIPYYKSFAIHKQKIYLIRGDSHMLSTLEKIKKILKGDRLDFLFIDGDHTYNGVKKDFEMYSALVRKGGIIAFHDIVPGPPENVGGVPTFWAELKNKFKHEEFVNDWKQGGYGIGVIYM